MSFFAPFAQGVKFLPSLTKQNPALFRSLSDIWSGLGKIGQTGVKVGVGTGIAGAGIFGATSAVNAGIQSITNPLEAQTGIKGISTIFIGAIIFIAIIMLVKRK
jgi:hypothetical protein